MKNSQPWCKKLLSDLSENCILIDHKNNLRLNYSEKIDFLFFIGRDRNKFGLPGNSFRRVNKIAFKVTVGTLPGKKLLIKLYFLFHFWTMSVSFPAFCLKIFIGFAKVLAFHLSKGTILRKSFQKLCTSSIIFGSWTNFFDLLLKLFQVLSKFKFYVSRGTCRVKVWCFAEIRNSYQFWKLRENFAAFSQDVFVGVVEIALHLSIWTFWGQKIREKIYDFKFIPRQWAEKSGFPSNCLSRDRQYRNLPVQGEENFSL